MSRIGAGKRAWETRRKNEAEAQAQADRKAAHSERAKKAWRTRRDRQTTSEATKAAKRSEAAKKAWVTRRKNGWVHPRSSGTT